MHYPCLADTSPAMKSIDEQRLDVTLIEQHEADRPIQSIDRWQERCARQRCLDEHVDLSTIDRREEIMRRVDRPAPDVDGAIVVGEACGPYPDFHGSVRRRLKVQPHHATIFGR